MDRQTERHLRNLESDLKTYEQTLKEAESRVERLILRVGGLRQQILKVTWFEGNEDERDALDALLAEIDNMPGPVNAEAWGNILAARDRIIELKAEAERKKLER